jgi:NADH-quinone oxidoreductase subunit E
MCLPVCRGTHVVYPYQQIAGYMMFSEQYAPEIQAIFSRYPADQKRAALMPLLHLAQRESGYVTKALLHEIADLCEVSVTEAASLVGFYSLYYDQPAGKYRIQVCTDLPCALRGAEQFLEKLCENLGIRLGETTADGLVTVEGVKCLAGCDKAPLFQVQTGAGIEYHENQTVENAMAYIEALKT